MGASFRVVGTTKGLVLVGSKTLRIFRGAFFKEEVLSISCSSVVDVSSPPDVVEEGSFRPFV